MTALANALEAIPEADRAAIIEHIHALARMPEAKRAAILTLTTN